jgi:hypothetical protein
MGERSLQFRHSCQEGNQRRYFQIEPFEGLKAKCKPEGLMENFILWIKNPFPSDIYGVVGEGFFFVS